MWALRYLWRQGCLAGGGGHQRTWEEGNIISNLDLSSCIDTNICFLCSTQSLTEYIHIFVFLLSNIRHKIIFTPFTLILITAVNSKVLWPPAMRDIILKRAEIFKSLLDSLTTKPTKLREKNNEVVVGFQNYMKSRQYQIFCDDILNSQYIVTVMKSLLLYQTSSSMTRLYHQCDTDRFDNSYNS